MAEENNPEETAGAQAPRNMQFALHRIYLKDMSFEAPLGVAAFQTQAQPKVEQDLNTSINKVKDNTFEVILKLTVNATVEDKTAFLVEVQQAGLFQISGVEGPQLAHIFNTMCAQILFPYAREAIDSAVVKGGFPALHLPPINFDALFAQAVRDAKAQANAGSNTSDEPAKAE